MSKSKIYKGINGWSFPDNFTIEQSMVLAKEANFEGIELTLSKDGELSLATTEKEALKIKERSKEIGIDINSVATGLFWQFSLTSELAHIREKAVGVIKKEIELAALLGADGVLVCPGAVGVDFRVDQVVPDAKNIEYYTGSEVISYEVAYERAQNAIADLAPFAKEHNVAILVENIWNKFLLSPLEFRTFLDEINSPYVGMLLDVGNIISFGYPEQWIRILGDRIKKLHFKDYRRAVGTIEGFVDLLAGDVNWPEVMNALDDIGYQGWANAEMTPNYQHYTTQIIYNTSLAMDKILKRS